MRNELGSRVAFPGGSSFAVSPGDSQYVTVTVATTGQVQGNVNYYCNDPDESVWQQETYANNSGFPQYGSVAPDFNLQGTDTRWHRLSDYRDKVVSLVFGASW